jgi:hypothetical protein
MRFLVDQLDALLGELVQLSPKILDLVCDVVHPGSTVREELPDRCFVGEGGDELDPAVPEANGSSLHALGLDGVAPLDLSAQQALVRVDRLVEILDRDPQVVNPLRAHAKGSYL